MSRLSHTLVEMRSTLPVLRHFVRQQLVLRYRRTVLGYVWTLLNPLLMMSITAVVFANLFKMDFKTYVVFMFSGMMAWNCFSVIITQSAGAFIQNEGLIKKIYLPKLIFPLSISLGALIDSVLSLAALFIIILTIGGNASWSLLFLPVAYALLFAFAFGIVLCVSVMTVFLRDLQHLITIALQALFFLTPILYDQATISGKLATLLMLNPMTYFVGLFRAPIRYGLLPEPHLILLCSLLAAASLAIGMLFFLSKENKIVFRL